MDAGILVPIAAFAMVFGIIFILVRKKERLAMIEKGADPSQFKSDLSGPSSLKWGLFSLGIGLGILVGNILVSTKVMEEEVAYFSMIFLFGGISLIVSHFLARKMEKD